MGSSLLAAAGLEGTPLAGVLSGASKAVPQAPFRRSPGLKIGKPAAAPAPPLTLDQLHTLMENACHDASGNPQVGAFFRTDWLIDNLRTQFHDPATVAAIGKLKYQTPFKNVKAALRVDLSRTDLTMDMKGNIWFTDFSPVIVLADPQSKIYNQLAVEFNPVLLKMDLDATAAGRLRFYLTTNDPKDPGFPTFVQTSLGANPPTMTGPDLSVVTANGYTAQTYADVERAIEASEAPLDILDSFIASLPLVAVVEAMRQFQIGVPLTFHFEQGYVIVHGPSLFSPSDKCGQMAGTTVTTTISPSPKPTTPPTPTSPEKNGFTFGFNHSVSAPAAPGVAGSPTPPFGYYFPIHLTFGDFGESVIGPGVVASDSGDAFCFHWAYQLSARPKPRSITITVPPNPGTSGFLAEIDIDCPLDVGGGAGVGMKIGCVMVPLLSSTIEGHVNPSKLSLFLKLVNSSQGPELVVTPQYDCSIDVNFYGPPMVDVLLNILMASFGNRLVAGALRNMVNSLSFPLVNLSALEYRGGQKGYAWRLLQNFRRQSALVTLEEGRIEH
jgi:hypothetical protein